MTLLHSIFIISFYYFSLSAIKKINDTLALFYKFLKNQQLFHYLSHLQRIAKT